MVKAGELVIEGKLNTSEIERGTNRIESSFKDIQATTRNSSSAMDSLFNITGKLANTIAKVGIVGVGALSGLAAFAPQTAGALASMGATTKQLSLVVGEALAPAFEKAATMYSNFVSSISAGDSILGASSNLIGNIFAGAFKDLENLMGGASDMWDKFNKSIEEKTGTTFTKEFISQLSEAGNKISDLGLIGGIKQEFTETKEATANLLGINTNALDFIGSVFGRFVGGGVGVKVIREVFYGTDTLGGN